MMLPLAGALLSPHRFAGAPPLVLPLLLHLLLALVPAARPDTLYMIMEYSTDGSVLLHQANITLRTLAINVTLLGCDDGYYDHYLLRPPTARITTNNPFDCRACTCTDFSSERVEDFFISEEASFQQPPQPQQQPPT